MSPDRRTLHATAVAHAGRAVLITGPSGSGKSGLALELIARGADLVADDRVAIAPGGLCVSPPPRLAGLIEARGVGLLTIPYVACAKVAFIVDMGLDVAARLPEARTRLLEGHSLPLINGKNSPNLAAVVWIMLQCDSARLLDRIPCPMDPERPARAAVSQQSGKRSS